MLRITAHNRARSLILAYGHVLNRLRTRNGYNTVMGRAIPSTQEQLALGRERYALAIDGNNDAVWDWNVATGEVWFSERWCAMLGYEPGQIEPHVSAWERLVHPEDMPHVMEVLTAHLEGRRAFYETEHRVLASDGHWHWILDRGRVVSRGTNGDALRAVGTHSDIHTSKTAELGRKVLFDVAEAIRQADAPDHAITTSVEIIARYLSVAQAGFGEVDTDEEHVIVHKDWNDGRMRSVVGAWKMDDFGPAFIREMKSGRTVPISDVEKDWRTNSDSILASHRSIGIRSLLDVPLVRAGKLVAMLFIHHPEPRLWNTVEIETVQQICERLWFAVEHERTAVALRQSESRFAIASLALGVAAWEWDVPAGTLHVSDGFEHLYGLPGGTINRADQIEALIIPEQRPYVGDRIRRALYRSDCPGFDVRYQVRSSQGHMRWIRSMGAVTERDRTGTALHIHGFVNDVSEQHKLEQELEAAQRKLLQSNRLSAMGTIASTLMHELNQPLTAIVNGVALAKMRVASYPDKDECIHSGLVSAEKAAFRAAEIVKRTKRFALTGEVCRTRQSLRALIESALQECRDYTEAHSNVTIEVMIEEDAIEVDLVQFTQVLQNLIRNAYQALARTDSPKLLISSIRYDRFISVRVEDNGIGIPADHRLRVFDPFHTTKPDGSGLGLAISRTLIEAHGGQLDIVDSDIGTAIRILIPEGMDSHE